MLNQSSNILSSAIVGETLKLAGELNLASMPRLLDETAAYASQSSLPDILTIDFTEVTDIDSSGVALLLHWRREAQKVGKELCYLHLPANLASLAELYGVDELIHCPLHMQHQQKKIVNQFKY